MDHSAINGGVLALLIVLILPQSDGTSIDNRGSEFWLAVPPNKVAGGDFNPLFYVTTDEDTPVPFTVRFKLTGTPSSYNATKGEIVKIEVPAELKINHANLLGQGNDMSILINSTDGRNLIVYGHNEETDSTDAFLALPKFETKRGTYEYYALSVGDSDQFAGTLVGFVVIVINEDNTDIRVTPTQNVVTFFGINTLIFAGDTRRRSRARMGEVFTFAASSGDLTGTRVTADKPITFLTGHECGFVPAKNTACDILLEQIPPTETWGFQFVLTPLTTREGSGFKFLASQDGTSVKISCNDADGDNVISESLSLNAGESDFKIYPKTYWCFVESNRPILVVTISLGYTFDEPIIESNLADPFMLMIPPLGQLSNDYTLVFSQSDAIGSFEDAVNFVPQINFIVPAADFDRGELILNNGAEDTSSINFIAIHDSSGEVAAYGAQFVPNVDPTAPTSPFSARFSGRGTTFGVLVYAWYRETAYGYPGGMRVDSIAVPIYCPISEPQPVGSETSGEILVPISRTGVVEGEACVQFEVGNGTAIINEDYRVEDDMCCFEAGERTTQCRIVVITDGDTEEDETLHFKIVPTADNCVCSDNLVVTIIKDPPHDEPKDIIVQFEQTEYSVAENGGFVLLQLIADKPAPEGGYNVMIFFADGSAGLQDYDNMSLSVFFDEGQTTATADVKIENDTILEHLETFTGQLLLPEGTADFIKIGPSDKATIDITDNDAVEVNFDPSIYSVCENDGSVELILVANASASYGYSVTVDTFDVTAINGSDYTGGSFEVEFPAGSTTASLRVDILDDNLPELDEWFGGLLSVSGVEGVTNGPQSLANVTISDEEEIFVQLDRAGYIFDEDVGDGILKLVADKPAPAGGYSVDVSFADGTAGSPGDYIGNTQSVFFPEGASSAQVAVPIFNDDFVEGDETFTAIIDPIAADGVRRGARNSTNVIIIDDEFIEVNFVPTSYEMNEEDGTATLIIVADRPSSEPYIVNVVTSDGTAEDPIDYIGGIFLANFSAGETTTTVTIPITDDDIGECTEVVMAQLELPSGIPTPAPATPGTPSPFSYSPKYRIGSKDMATIKINDTDRELKI